MIALKKAKSSDHWDTLEYKKPILNDDMTSDKKEANKDPSAGLMDMMKQMYENGDDNMKRMIAETWTKSQSQKDHKFDKFDM